MHTYTDNELAPQAIKIKGKALTEVKVHAVGNWFLVNTCTLFTQPVHVQSEPPRSVPFVCLFVSQSENYNLSHYHKSPSKICGQQLTCRLIATTNRLDDANLL